MRRSWPTARIAIPAASGSSASSTTTEFRARRAASKPGCAWPLGRLDHLHRGEARRDVEHGLRITLQHYTTLEGQQRMLEILQFKLDVLWSMLDAMSMAYELERPPYHTVTRDPVWHRGIAL